MHAHSQLFKDARNKSHTTLRSVGMCDWERGYTFIYASSHVASNSNCLYSSEDIHHNDCKVTSALIIKIYITI